MLCRIMIIIYIFVFISVYAVCVCGCLKLHGKRNLHNQYVTVVVVVVVHFVECIFCNKLVSRGGGLCPGWFGFN